MNDKLVAEVQAAKEKIMNHFPGILTALPRTIDTGSGYKAHFDAEGFAKGIMNQNKYEASNNIFVLDPLSWPTKGTPIKTSSIFHLRKQYFEPPTGTFPDLILVGALRTGEDPRNGPVQQISPPELCWSALLACAADIDAACGAETMALWEQTLLSVTVRFEVIDNDNERVWRALAMREALVQQGESVNQSPVQRMFSVVETRQLLEKQAGCTLGAELSTECNGHRCV